MLLIAAVISLGYELWRATERKGETRYDSLRAVLVELGWLYLIAVIVVVLLLVGVPFAAWIALVFSVVLILVSIFYYNPRIMIARNPSLIDWAEDLVYTGLLFVAAAFLILEVSGLSLS